MYSAANFMRGIKSSRARRPKYVHAWETAAYEYKIVIGYLTGDKVEDA